MKGANGPRSVRGMVRLLAGLAAAVLLLGGGAVAATAGRHVPRVELATLVTDAGAAVVTEPIRDRVDDPAVQLQLDYALSYWNHYNVDAYGDFNPWGGDCQNFVSQTLVARGWVPNEEWFNQAQEDWAPAFVHVPSFDEYLRSHPELGATELPLQQRAAVKLGDLVVYDWDRDGTLDHIEVVARIERSPEGRVAIATLGHSDVNSFYRDLDDAITLEHPGALAYVWSIP